MSGVELTVDAAWFIADTTGAGAFPWVLAVTPPCRDRSEWAAFAAEQTERLSRLGLIRSGEVDPLVRKWIGTVCNPQCWLDIRCIRGADGNTLRGIVACRRDSTVVALRNAQYITFSVVQDADAHSLAEVVTAGLGGCAPASFDEFTIPTRTGTRVDEQLRAGACLTGILDHLRVPDTARPVVRAAFEAPYDYVEVVAGRRSDGRRHSTEVGVGVLDTVAGRVVVSPHRAFDGEWLSTFASGTPSAIADALVELATMLPGDERDDQ